MGYVRLNGGPRIKLERDRNKEASGGLPAVAAPEFPQ